MRDDFPARAEILPTIERERVVGRPGGGEFRKQMMRVGVDGSTSKRILEPTFECLVMFPSSSLIVRCAAAVCRQCQWPARAVAWRRRGASVEVSEVEFGI